MLSSPQPQPLAPNKSLVACSRFGHSNQIRFVMVLAMVGHCGLALRREDFWHLLQGNADADVPTLPQKFDIMEELAVGCAGL